MVTLSTRNLLLVPSLSLVLATEAVAACPPIKQVARPTGGPAAWRVAGNVHKVPLPSRHIPMPDGPLSGIEITLTREACFGNCPVYSVTLKGDGSATYHGEHFVLIPGDRSFGVDPERMACLVDQFRKADFWSLRPEYVASVTDNPSYSLTVTIGGQTKHVTDYVGLMVGMPASVRELEGAVDEIGGIRWATGDSSTLASLKAEGFVFRSREGANLLARAVERAPDSVVLALIQNGAPPDGRGAGLSSNGTGPTALEAAALRARTRVIDALLQAGALDNATPDEKAAAMGAAKRSGDPSTVKMLQAAIVLQ